jgi:hypothetical protein
MNIGPRLAARLAAGVCVLTFVAAFASVVIILMLDSEAPYEHATSMDDSLFWLFLSLTFPMVGGLIALKRPGNLVGWALLLPGLDVMGGTLLFAYSELALFAKPEADLPGGMVAFVIASGSWTALMAGVFLLFLLFPNGEVPSAGWRFISRLILLFFALIWFFIATSPEPDPPLQDFRNPLAFADTEALAYLAFLFVPPCLIAVAAAGIRLVIRFRRSTGDEREQFKWLGFAAGFFVLTLPPAILDNWGEGLATLPFTIALFALPVSVGVAVLKYHLYEIDVIINRTLVYVPLTAILAGLFVASTTLARTVFTDLTDAGSDASIAISTLAVVALLTPLKNKLQALVDRHFKEQPDPYAGVRKLSAQARSVVEVLDRERFAQSILSELVAGLVADAARVELRDGDLSLTAGTPGDAIPVTAPLLHEEEAIGTLTVWPGRGARAVTPSAEDLADTAGALAAVISLGLIPEGPSAITVPEVLRR